MEVEDNQQLPYLDELVFKKDHNRLGLTIYKRKIHTNRYMNAK